MCNYCITLDEKKRAAATVDRVEILDIKVDTITRELRDEFLELKKLLKAQITSKHNVIDNVEPVSAESSPMTNQVKDNMLWSQRVENLKHMVTVKNQSDGTALCPELLEKTCAESGVSVIKTFSLQKSKDTAIVCNSRIGYIYI